MLPSTTDRILALFELRRFGLPLLGPKTAEFLRRSAPAPSLAAAYALLRQPIIAVGFAVPHFAVDDRLLPRACRRAHPQRYGGRSLTSLPPRHSAVIPAGSTVPVARMRAGGFAAAGLAIAPARRGRRLRLALTAATLPQRRARLPPSLCRRHSLRGRKRRPLRPPLAVRSARCTAPHRFAHCARRGFRPRRLPTWLNGCSIIEHLRRLRLSISFSKYLLFLLYVLFHMRTV